jgi:hypothetical protein
MHAHNRTILSPTTARDLSKQRQSADPDCFVTMSICSLTCGHTPLSDASEVEKLVYLNDSAYKSKVSGIMKTCRWKRSL